ncbi:MAG TPA: lanthionine synthetase C family protein [Polyangiaceae bacterium]|nr:lanthionine synthetase C family protein [Polyangiaceae bacterium]
MSEGPLLTGASAARARDALEQIGAALLAHAPEAGDPSLFTGTAGLAVFHAEAAALGVGDAAAHAERAGRLLEQSVESAGGALRGWSLCAGLAGLAWALQTLDANIGDVDRDLDAVDEVLFEQVSKGALGPEFDLLYGIAGIGLYAASRPGSAGTALAGAVVDALAQNAQPQPVGLTWATPYALLPEEFRKFHVDGELDLGMAHGCAGVVVVLASILRAGLVPGAATLLEQAVAWLLSQRLEPGAGGRFPGQVGPGLRPRAVRNAWCIGDPGVGWALLYAGRAASNEAWEAEGRATLRRAAERPRADWGVVDAGVCHGAAGLALLYRCAFQATGDPACADAARRWIDEALGLRRPGEPLAGFQSWDRERGWLNESGLLAGAAGVGLALASCLGERESAWDTCLGLAPCVPP